MGALPAIPGEPTVDSVGNPSDLTGLGVKMSEYLRNFEELRYDSGPSEIALAFDSITALLQHTELETAFRFLHIVTTQAATSNITAQYHINPDAHETQTLATLSGLFDARIDVTGPDPTNWTVSGLSD